MLRRLRVGDRRVEPVDHVRRGVARSVVDPGQRPRRRRVVAARDGSQPARPRHDPGPFELVEGAEGEGRGADTATRAAHTEIGGRRQFTHGDRLVLPRYRHRRLLAPGDRQQAHGGDAEQTEAVGEHLQPGHRRHEGRREEVVGIREASVVGPQGDPRHHVLDDVDRRRDERQGDDETLPALQSRRLVQRPPAAQDPAGGDRVPGDQHTVGKQRRPRLAEVVPAVADPLVEPSMGTRELRALVEVGARGGS